MNFVSNTPLASFGGTPSAMDFSSLARLKRGVQGGADAPADQQRQVARQFEALFIQMLLKQVRQASAQMPTPFDSQATRMAQSLSDEQAALSMADPGLGLADALMAQMRAGSGDPLDPLANPPEAAPSRLPGLQSRIGEDAANGRRVVADSITDLIQLLAGGHVKEKVAGAVQGAPEHIRRFVDRMAGAADAAAAVSGVPAKLILSQAALESSWGQREILRPDGTTSHNLFGIKAGGSWQGDVVHVMTTEYDGATPRKTEQPFRAYDSYADSFADYASLVGNSARYSAVLSADSAEEAARRIQDAGYATDPSYADKLIAIMGYFQAR